MAATRIKRQISAAPIAVSSEDEKNTPLIMSWTPARKQRICSILIVLVKENKWYCSTYIQYMKALQL